MTILITGCNGLVGNALKTCLSDQSYLAPSSKELNLLETQAVNQYFENNKIDLVFHLAAKVGGVKANSDGLGVFFYENIP
jgi:GDP-L-fucose synthase